MKLIVITLGLLIFSVIAHGMAPVVSNATMTQRTDGSMYVDIIYDLADAENNACTISITISNDAGNTYTIVPTLANLSGAIGSGIIPGTGKHVIWNIGNESYSLNSNQYRIKVIAEDGSSDIPASFVYINGGSFTRSNLTLVTVSSFYLDKYEVTQSAYLAVMGTNPSFFSSLVNGPVDRVSWFNAIEYCNKRSINEGLTPCYSYSTYGVNPVNWPVGWNTVATNHTNVSCSWTANGYRLPTEAEWQYAAKGGTNTVTDYSSYSGSTTIGGVAWYTVNSGGTPHTVGTKSGNELGLCDMSGNLGERLWDIYGTYPTGAQTNPHGATSGTDRTIRGGSWNYADTNCTVAYRYSNTAIHSIYYVGFRVCRISQ